MKKSTGLTAGIGWSLKGHLAWEQGQWPVEHQQDGTCRLGWNFLRVMLGVLLLLDICVCSFYLNSNPDLEGHVPTWVLFSSPVLLSPF